MKNNRREFLQKAATIAGLTLITGAEKGILSSFINSSAKAADISGYKAIVCLFMYGGQDCHDTIFPYDQASYTQYMAARPELLNSYASLNFNSRARENLLPINPVNASDFSGRQFALSTELAPIKSLFDSGKAAIIGNVGPLIQPITRADLELENPPPVPERLMSHNDQQITWMSLKPEGNIYGWGGLFADTVNSFGANQNPVFTSINTSPLGNAVFLSGRDTSQYMLDAGLGTPTVIAGLDDGGDWVLGEGYQSPTLADMIRTHYKNSQYTGTNLFEKDVAQIAKDAFEANEQYINAQSGVTPLQTTFPDTFLGKQLKTIANTINMRNNLNVSRQVFFASPDSSFDTHDEQITLLPALQASYAESIAAFHQATVEMGIENDVLLFTASDFGRSLSGNGDGTDHGWGGHHFVVGGDVIGNKIYGDIPPPIFGHDYDFADGRLIPKVSIEQYAATIGTWFGLSEQELTTIMPNLVNFQNHNLGFMI